MSNLLRKIAGIKPLYIHIFLLSFLLTYGVSFAFCMYEQVTNLPWETKCRIYLREEGYIIDQRYPQIYVDGKGFGEVEVVDYEPLIYEVEKAVPYQTKEEAWPWSHFWNKWIKWPVRILAGLLGVFVTIRFTYTISSQRQSVYQKA